MVLIAGNSASPHGAEPVVRVNESSKQMHFADLFLFSSFCYFFGGGSITNMVCFITDYCIYEFLFFWDTDICNFFQF